VLGHERCLEGSSVWVCRHAGLHTCHLQISVQSSVSAHPHTTAENKTLRHNTRDGSYTEVASKGQPYPKLQARPHPLPHTHLQMTVVQPSVSTHLHSQSPPTFPLTTHSHSPPTSPLLPTHLQMTVVQPKVSTDGSVRTIAFSFAILRVPRAKQVVTTAGRPSGIAATASATAILK
jgi:hypothetical protein